MILTDEEIKDAVGFTTDQMVAYRRVESAVLDKLKAQEPMCWTNDTELSYSQFKRPDGELTSGSFWAEYHEDCDIPLYTHPLPPADVVRDAERYRWLRSNERGMNSLACVINDDCNPPYFELKCTEELDSAIDAAMKEMK